MSDPVQSTASSDSANARRSARVQVDIPVQVFANNMACPGRGHELGLIGMAIHVPIDLNEGQVINIMFQPPNSKARFGLMGKVRNRQNFRYGIEFVQLGATESAELTRVVKELSPSSSIAS